MISRKFTEEQDRWLIKNHCPSQTIREFTKAFNTVFSESRTNDVMKSHCRFLGLKQDKKWDTYSKDDIDWLREREWKYSAKEMTIEYNKTHKTLIS